MGLPLHPRDVKIKGCIASQRPEVWAPRIPVWIQSPASALSTHPIAGTAVVSQQCSPENLGNSAVVWFVAVMLMVTSMIGNCSPKIHVLEAESLVWQCLGGRP